MAGCGPCQRRPSCAERTGCNPCNACLGGVRACGGQPVTAGQTAEASRLNGLWMPLRWALEVDLRRSGITQLAPAVLRPALCKPLTISLHARVASPAHTSWWMGGVVHSLPVSCVSCLLPAPPPCRWYNHLDPLIKRGPWTEDEDRKIITLQHHLGNKWADIALQIVGRCVALALGAAAGAGTGVAAPCTGRRAVSEHRGSAMGGCIRAPAVGDDKAAAPAVVARLRCWRLAALHPLLHSAGAAFAACALFTPTHPTPFSPSPAPPPQHGQRDQEPVELHPLPHPQEGGGRVREGRNRAALHRRGEDRRHPAAAGD